MDSTTGIFFWGFLIVYGIVMFLLSPKTVSLGGFFKGEDKLGRAANPWMITASIFIAWILSLIHILSLLIDKLPLSSVVI